MQLNVLSPKLERIVRICNAAGAERTKAEMARDGLFDLQLTFMWLLDLASGNKNVDVRARTAGIKLAAREALEELSPLVVAGAGKGDPCLKAWEHRARKFLTKEARLPQLYIA
jgi:hypothetical protein